MKLIYKALLLVLLFNFGCKTKNETAIQTDNKSKVAEADFTIAFGSCNKQYSANDLWDDILAKNPNLWIWGGDNIYSDTYDMSEIKAAYEEQIAHPEYKKLVSRTKILGTWDDHDYGKNDAGAEYTMKKESQQLFLDFMGVSETDKRRNIEGIYYSEVLKIDKGSIKIIVLDTRYFRSELEKDTQTKKRYKPTKNTDTTILGETQWQWLNNELKSSNANFNIIVGSIQFLSKEHGFETWGNFPHEVNKLQNVIVNSKAKGVLLLSGDRHISEFSRMSVEGLSYPLIDFTSSGLTHSYTNFSGENNKYRVGKVVSGKSYGLLNFDFKKSQITMQMFADNNRKLQEITQQY